MNLLTMPNFLIICLAAYRLTHLIVFDKIFEPFRNYFVQRDFRGPVPTYELQGGPVRRCIGKLLNCHWCTGIWVSFVLIFGCWYAYKIVIVICFGFAVSAVLSLIETVWMKYVGFPELHEKERDPKETEDRNGIT